MKLTVFTHPDCLKHEMGSSHPESPERLIAMTQTLKENFPEKITWEEASLATKDHLILVHEKNYVDQIFSLAPQSGYVQLDPDTAMNAFTLTAALRASGAVIKAVDRVFAQEIDRAFCLVRPPGHHAEPNQAMGFCFFNNIAVGIAHALKHYCQRVALVDFDVHHGNGSETMFSGDDRVCFWSSFQHPFYPGAQLNHKPPNIHLCPLPAGSGSDLFREKVTKDLIPLLNAFKPDCIFISAGFDAHRLDPLANLGFTEDDYEFITAELVKVAKKTCGGRIISTLEGGYNFEALAKSAVAHVRALLR